MTIGKTRTLYITGKINLFSGFVHIHSKRKLGDRTILLAGKSAGYTEATVKLKVQSYKQRENEEMKKSANQKMEMTVIQPNYQSEVLKLFAKNQQKIIKRSIDSNAMVRFFRTSKDFRLKWGVSSQWSSSLYFPVWNPDQMNIAKAHLAVFSVL